MADKKVRNLKVYGYPGRWHSDPPFIMLKGQWLQKLGFDCGDQIEVECKNEELRIRRMTRKSVRFNLEVE